LKKKSIFYVLGIVLVSAFLFPGSLSAGSNFLWELSGPQGEFYLMGSIHYMPSGSYPLDDVIYSRLEEADVMAVEADITEVDQFELQRLIMEEAFLEDGKKLRNKFSAGTYEKIIDIVSNLGLSAEDIDGFAPWYVSMIIAQVVLEEIGMDAAEGVDNHMIKKARQKGKEIVELESMVDQLRFMSEMDLDIQKAALRDTIAELEYSQSMIKEIVSAWQAGEVEPVREFLFKQREKSPEIQKWYSKMTDDREIGMRDEILSLLEEYRKPFVVVGSAHVVNDVGLLYHFEKLGYDIKQL